MSRRRINPHARERIAAGGLLHRRAMPLDAPMSLSDDEVYAVSAYILSLNGIIGEDEIMNAQTLPAVKMPNREGFVNAWKP